MGKTRNLVNEIITKVNSAGTKISSGQIDKVHVVKDMYDADRIEYLYSDGRRAAFGQANFEAALVGGTLENLPVYSRVAKLVDGAFEGGGAKALAYMGGIHAMAHCGVWFDRIAGTSGGSLIAALIAAGYKVDLNYEINSLVTEISGEIRASENNSLNKILFEEKFGGVADFKEEDDPNANNSATSLILKNIILQLLTVVVKLKASDATPDDVERLLKFSDNDAEHILNSLMYDKKVLKPQYRKIVRAIHRLIMRGGFWTGNVVKDLLEKHLDAIVPRESITRNGRTYGGRSGPNGTVAFRDLPMDFCCTATDIGPEDEEYVDQNLNQIVYFSTQKTPDFSVSEAVRRCISLPVVFYPRKINEGNGRNFSTAGNPDASYLIHNNNILLDGGFRINLPLGVFLERNPDDQVFKKPNYENNVLRNKLFAFNLTDLEELGVRPAAVPRKSEPEPLRSFISIFDDILDLLPSDSNEVNSTGIKRFWKVISQTSDYTNGNRQEQEIIDLMDAVPGVAPVNIPMKDPNAKDKDDRFSGEAFGMPNVAKKWIAHSAWIRTNEALKGKLNIDGVVNNITPYKHQLGVDILTPQTGSINTLPGTNIIDLPAILHEPFYSDNTNLVFTSQREINPNPNVGTGIVPDLGIALPMLKPILSNGARGRNYDGIGTYWIKTRNADKENSSATYLRFRVDNSVRIYLLLDTLYKAQRSALPEFIRTGGWVESNIKLTSSAPGTMTSAAQAGPEMFVMHKDFPKGEITLGGPRSGGGGGNVFNYAVLIVQRN